MAASAGHLALLKIKNTAGTPAYETVGGLRTREIKLNQETVDVTSADDTTKWRQLLSGVGIRSASISGSGVIKDVTADITVKDAYANQRHADWQITIPGLFTIEGAFQITELTFGADHNGAVTWSVSLESAGDLTITAL